MGKSEPRVLVAHVASDGGILLIDVLQVGPLEHWLVPEWLEWPDKALQTPARAIRLEGLAYQPHGIGAADLTINSQVPKAVLDGQSRQIAGREVEVLEGPHPRLPVLPLRRGH